jgi:hypothetical protein
MSKDNERPTKAVDGEHHGGGHVVSPVHTVDGTGAQHDPEINDHEPVAADGVTGTESSDTYTD